MNNTSKQFDSIVKICKDIYVKKLNDYGTAWRILRTPSITDQIFIKAQRIRSIEEKGTQMVDDDIRGEYIGIVNYSIMALIQIELKESSNVNLPVDDAIALYDNYFQQSKSLMENKNHDYGEAWREMRINSLTDIILMKLMRIKQIEDHNGKTFVSEGVDANYYDMINYAVFALIKIEFEK